MAVIRRELRVVLTLSALLSCGLFVYVFPPLLSTTTLCFGVTQAPPESIAPLDLLSSMTKNSDGKKEWPISSFKQLLTDFSQKEKSSPSSWEGISFGGDGLLEEPPFFPSFSSPWEEPLLPAAPPPPPPSIGALATVVSSSRFVDVGIGQRKELKFGVCVGLVEQTWSLPAPDGPADWGPTQGLQVRCTLVGVMLLQGPELQWKRIEEDRLVNLYFCLLGLGSIVGRLASSVSEPLSLLCSSVPALISSVVPSPWASKVKAFLGDVDLTEVVSSALVQELAKSLEKWNQKLWNPGGGALKKKNRKWIEEWGHMEV